MLTPFVTVPLQEFIDRGFDASGEFRRAIQFIDKKDFPAMGGRYIAGGSIRRALLNLEPADYDICFSTDQHLREFKAGLIGRSFFIAKESTAAITLKSQVRNLTVQLSYTFGVISDNLAAFDFTLCQFAYHGGDITFSPMALHDALSKRIVINSMKNPKSTAKRFMRLIAEEGHSGDLRDYGKLLNMIEQTHNFIEN